MHGTRSCNEVVRGFFRWIRVRHNTYGKRAEGGAAARKKANPCTLPSNNDAHLLAGDQAGQGHAVGREAGKLYKLVDTALKQG